MRADLSSVWSHCVLIAFLTLLYIPGSLQHRGHSAHMEDKPTGFHDSKVVHDAEHIKEHYEGQVNLTDTMTDQELEFHYFKQHDFDNNTKLDGIEIYFALTHLLPYDEDNKEIQKKPGQTPEEYMQMRREEEHTYYTTIVDNVLQEDDLNHDGYLTYVEYMIARRASERQEEARQKAASGRTASGGH